MLVLALLQNIDPFRFRQPDCYSNPIGPAFPIHITLLINQTGRDTDLSHRLTDPTKWLDIRFRHGLLPASDSNRHHHIAETRLLIFPLTCSFPPEQDGQTVLHRSLQQEVSYSDHHPERCSRFGIIRILPAEQVCAARPVIPHGLIPVGLNLLYL